MATEKEILFNGFSETDRREFLAMGKERSFNLHDTVIQEDTPGGSMAIIEEGKVSVWIQDSKVADLGPGDTLSTMVVLTAARRTATVRAEGEVSIIEFTREDIMDFFKRKPPRLFQQFFVNLACIQINLTNRANKRIVYLDRRLREMG